MRRKENKVRILSFEFFFLILIIILLIINRTKKEDIISLPRIVVSTGTFSSNDSLYTVLKMRSIPEKQIFYIVNSIKRKININRIISGEKYEIRKSTSGEFIEFFYFPQNPSDRYYRVYKSTSEEYICDELLFEFEITTETVKGQLKDAEFLWLSMSKKGFSDEFIYRFTDIFQWQIDFNTEQQKGDIYTVVYQKVIYRDRKVKEGKILAANYKGFSAGNHTAIYFESECNGYYYDSDGKSLQKMFLKAPLSYRRISSYFSMRRFHPILRYYRPHQGIDYAAPKGTPVSSIGDGLVIFAGWKGQAGKTVIIKHNSVYTTQYGHLSGFAKGISKGKRVKQGQVIGYVGATGLATGPHLDFRITQYGKPVNFLKLKFPPNKSIPQNKMQEFEEIKKEMLYLINSARDS